VACQWLGNGNNLGVTATNLGVATTNHYFCDEGSFMANILVVEDSAVDRVLLESILAKNSQWQIEFACDGVEAMEWLQDRSNALPDVIITDMQMPRMDGLSLVRKVRQQMSQIPVIVITSKGSEEYAMKALRLGATSYSPKRMLRSDLRRTVEQIIHMARYMRYTHDTEKLPAPKSVAFVLENESSLIGPAIEHMQGNLPDWSDRDRWQFAIAIDEALVNAMHHGNLEVDSELRDSENEQGYYDTIRDRKQLPPFCHRRVRVEAEFSDQHICVQITDEGKGFDVSSIADPCSGANLHCVSGRGLFLIRSFMDQVSHNQTGNQITMTKIRKI